MMAVWEEGNQQNHRENGGISSRSPLKGDILNQYPLCNVYYGVDY